MIGGVGNNTVGNGVIFVCLLLLIRECLFLLRSSTVPATVLDTACVWSDDEDEDD